MTFPTHCWLVRSYICNAAEVLCILLLTSAGQSDHGHVLGRRCEQLQGYSCDNRRYLCIIDATAKPLTPASEPGGGSAAPAKSRKRRSREALCVGGTKHILHRIMQALPQMCQSSVAAPFGACEFQARSPNGTVQDVPSVRSQLLVPSDHNFECRLCLKFHSSHVCRAPLHVALCPEAKGREIVRAVPSGSFCRSCRLCDVSCLLAASCLYVVFRARGRLRFHCGETKLLLLCGHGDIIT
mmetsp:Transcript_63055/g.117999  ORF Transcript_63055/g.117999 Transcript_63055/m.117999 type:complete len:240 (-) Transcript_63055:51-770(-)